MKPLLDVLVILDALEKEGSFAAASAKLFKTPSALSYTIHRLESDLNIQLLDRSGHRARFTPSGQMLLEKGREVLHIARELENRAVKLQQGWENSLRLAVDSTFPVALLSPPIAAFYQQQPLTRLHFTLNPSLLDWRPLTDGQADLLLGALGEPPPLSGYDYLPPRRAGAAAGRCPTASAGATPRTAKLANPAPLPGGGHWRGRGATQRSGDPDGV